jgi:hypothetical protein
MSKFKGRNLRISYEIAIKVEALALAENRSINNTVATLVLEALEARKEKNNGRTEV